MRTDIPDILRRLACSIEVEDDYRRKAYAAGRAGDAKGQTGADGVAAE